MRVAYSYIRCSTGKQEDGFGLIRQDQGAIAHCQKMGWTLDNKLKFSDLKSAFKGDNSTKGALGKFRAAIKSGRIKKGEVLICESIDRLSRMPYDPTYMLIREILSSGVDIVTLFYSWRK